MFTKILGKNYLVKTWLIAILVINGLEVLVMQVGRAENFVLSQQPLTTQNSATNDTATATVSNQQTNN